MAKINVPLLAAITIGIVLIAAMYLTYILVMSPFYTLESFEIKKTNKRLEVRGVNLTSGEPGWSTFNPTAGTVGGMQTVRRPDFNISLAISLKIGYGSPCKEVNVTVYCDHEVLLSRTLNESSPISNWNLTKEFPMGMWRLGLEKPLEIGHHIWIEFENFDANEVRVDITYEGFGYYRVGTMLNFFIIMIGIVILVGSVLHTIYLTYRGHLKKKIREVALESEKAHN